jgi:hypothetical protein
MGEEYYCPEKVRTAAAIPNNQDVAIRIHDTKLSEGTIPLPSRLDLVTDFPDPSAPELTKFQKLHRSHESLVEYLETNPAQCASIRAM